jgi:hypothetical protein
LFLQNDVGVNFVLDIRIVACFFNALSGVDLL